MNSFIIHLLFDNVPIDNVISLCKDYIKANAIWAQKKRSDFDFTSALQQIYLLLSWCEITFLNLNLNKEIYSTVKGKWGHGEG